MQKAGTVQADGDIGIGFSDTVLLTVSLIGFVILSVTVYSIIMLKLKTAHELEADEDNPRSYEDSLDKADVSKLNRAQRRARAKNIMKRQRRIAPAGGEAALQDGDNVEGDNQNDNDSVGNEESETDPAKVSMSRKQRDKAAKEAERAERKLFHEERQKKQEIELEKAKQRKQERKLAQQKRQQQQKSIRKQQEEAQKLSEYNQWRMFLSSDFASITVKEFVLRAKEEKIADLQKVAEEVHLPTQQIIERINRLIEARRVTGIILDNRRFLYVTTEQLKSIAEKIRDKNEFSVQDLSDLASPLLDLKKEE